MMVVLQSNNLILLTNESENETLNVYKVENGR